MAKSDNTGTLLILGLGAALLIAASGKKAVVTNAAKPRTLKDGAPARLPGGGTTSLKPAGLVDGSAVAPPAAPPGLTPVGPSRVRRTSTSAEEAFRMKVDNSRLEEAAADDSWLTFFDYGGG